MKILICGDRNWTNKSTILNELVFYQLDEHGIINDNLEVIHGNAHGADRLGAWCAMELGLQVKSFPAQWDKFGRAAGQIRNNRMLDEKPDLVLAFHNNIEQSRGTKHCITEAKKRGIEVKLITE